MIYTLVGTNPKVREKAKVEFERLGPASAHIYGEHVPMVEGFINAQSLFGEAVVVHLMQTLERAEGREIMYELLKDMEESSTLFVIDEPFADANRVKKLEKYSKKLYDAREEKKEEVTPFSLANAFARRDKKNAWLEWMEIKDELEPEGVQGMLWWKFQGIWADAKSGRRSGYSLAECEKIGGELLRSSILAHRGELDLKSELERIILSI